MVLVNWFYWNAHVFIVGTSSTDSKVRTTCSLPSLINIATQGVKLVTQGP